MMIWVLTTALIIVYILGAFLFWFVASDEGAKPARSKIRGTLMIVFWVPVMLFSFIWVGLCRRW